MPCVEDWRSNPMHVVQNLFALRKDDTKWKEEVNQYFTDKLKSTASWRLVSSINDKPLHDFQPNCLVRFRCMIQDTYEPEYYLETYQVVNKISKEKMLNTGRFKDIVSCPENCEVPMDSESSTTGCRQVLYCVSIPAEGTWVKEKFKIKCFGEGTSGSSSNRPKRSHDDDDDDGAVAMDTDTTSTVEGSPAKKTQRTSAPNEVQRQKPLTRNHPLPNEDGPACIVKVYDEDIDFKINDIYEFVGILSVDPELSSSYDEGEINGVDPPNLEEHRARCPPASFIPRLHCVAKFKLEHSNPLLPYRQPFSSVQEDFNLNAASLRQDVVTMFKQVTFGDELLAEFLLLHLVSRVYARQDVMAVGKMSLNVTNIPGNSCYPKLLADFLSSLLTKAHYLPMTLDNMNTLNFIPAKNYSTNRVDSGILQLSNGTHLTIDETALRPGQLNHKGVKNIQALDRLLKTQMVDYDFQFHPVMFHHDVSVLVLSEAKSVLSCDCRLPLRPEIPVPSDLQAYFSNLTFSADFVDKVRAYLTVARLSDYDIDTAMMKTIEDDFVAARQGDPEKMTADDLHAHLVLSRSLSTSCGESKTNIERWNKVKKLEEERKSRLQ